VTVLLVSSGGGHLKQLHDLVPRLGVGDRPRLWVTFDSGLSRTLLANEEVVYARHAVPRDAKNIALNSLEGISVLRRHRFTMAVSTGASPAVSYLVQTALRGVPSHYIETAARADGPSLTGRIMARVPGVTTYTQYPSWAAGQWCYAGSVFDAYGSGTPTARTSIRSAVVSLGTAESYGFRRLVERLVPLLDGCRVTWQTGATHVSDLPIEGREQVPHDELLSAISHADVVISHAGTGAALTALEQGRMPLLVPRRAAHREHVDDHQQQIAAELSRRGLAVAREVEDVDRSAILEAASGGVARLATPPPFRLHGTLHVP
jgi:UDP-N-acetylglucosamine--N-acetylmuramyl-(pentapeptide) pyrophosphoryl-undecaprenol N-acetylglucosamine transferase